MAKDQRNVEAITPMEEDFAKWYTDICLKAELVDYASVKGFLILRPYGYAIWENIQKYMDAEFKKTGHVNVAMPVLIPESLLKKEGELVEGFAPEVAWVTHGGSEPLEERLAFRPTSETMFCDHWSHVLHSYRELPMLYNQWCSVIRWEKTTRPFLRSREFWWQEGHTIHETAAEAEAETEQQLNCYADVCRNALAMPVVKGRKTDKEKFAGAEATYTIECMMKDHKALQSGTSHFFGDKFSLPPPGTTPCAPSLRRNTGPCGRRSWQTAPTSPIRRRRWPIRPDAAPCPAEACLRGRRRTALSAPAPKGTGRVWWCIRSCWARSCGPFCPICPGWSRGSAFWCGALWPSVRQRPAAGSLGCSSGSPRIGRRPGTGPAPPILDWHLTKILHFLRCRGHLMRPRPFLGKSIDFLNGTFCFSHTTVFLLW